MASTMPLASRVALYTNPAPEPSPVYCYPDWSSSREVRAQRQRSWSRTATHKNLQGKEKTIVYERCECLGSLPPFFQEIE